MHLVLSDTVFRVQLVIKVINLFNYYECFFEVLCNKPTKPQLIVIFFTHFNLAVIELTERNSSKYDKL